MKENEIALELKKIVEVVNEKSDAFLELYGKNNYNAPAKKELDEVLATFNTNFIKWMHRHKAVANFMFDYRGGKKIVIQDIIIPIYKREPKSAQEIIKKIQEGEAKD